MKTATPPAQSNIRIEMVLPRHGTALTAQIVQTKMNKARTGMAGRTTDGQLTLATMPAPVETVVKHITESLSLRRKIMKERQNGQTAPVKDTSPVQTTITMSSQDNPKLIKQQMHILKHAQPVLNLILGKTMANTSKTVTCHATQEIKDGVQLTIDTPVNPARTLAILHGMMGNMENCERTISALNNRNEKPRPAQSPSPVLRTVRTVSREILRNLTQTGILTPAQRKIDKLVTA